MRANALIVGLLVFFLALPTASFSKTKSTSKALSCNVPGYHCLRVKSGQSWTSLFPNVDQRDIVMRINHTNRSLYAGMKIKVPNNLASTDLLDHSPFATQIDPPGEKLIIVDLKKHAWGAYDEDGSMMRWGSATGGNSWCRDIGRSCRTKAGTFRIYTLGNKGCRSHKYPRPHGGAPMPYCMFFNGGQGLHGSPGGVMAGNESHGCVRLFVDDAEWLRFDFVEGPNSDNNYRGTKVVVLPYS